MEPVEPIRVVEPEILGPESSEPQFKSSPFFKAPKVVKLNGPLAILGVIALPIGILLMFTLGIIILVGMFATSLLGTFGIGVTRGMGLPKTKSKR